MSRELKTSTGVIEQLIEFNGKNPFVASGKVVSGSIVRASELWCNDEKIGIIDSIDVNGEIVDIVVEGDLCVIKVISV